MAANRVEIIRLVVGLVRAASAADLVHVNSAGIRRLAVTHVEEDHL